MVPYGGRNLHFVTVFALDGAPAEEEAVTAALGAFVAGSGAADDARRNATLKMIPMVRNAPLKMIPVSPCAPLTMIPTVRPLCSSACA